MQLVEHHAPETAEQIRRVGAGQQQRQLLRRGQQDVRRIAALALAFRCRRVAGAGLDADRQAHLADRRFEVARDIDGERLQRRDVERVQALGAPQIVAGRDDPARLAAALVKLHQRRQKARQRLAAAGRRDQQHRAAVPRARQKLELMRARRPAARREPARKNVRQQRRGVDFLGEDRIHGRRYVPVNSLFAPGPGRRRWRCRGYHQQARHRHALLGAGRYVLDLAQASARLRRCERAHGRRHGHSAASPAAARPAGRGSRP